MKKKREPKIVLFKEPKKTKQVNKKIICAEVFLNKVLSSVR